MENAGKDETPEDAERKGLGTTATVSYTHLVAENLTTGETSSIRERPQEENYSAPAGVAEEKVVQHIGAEIERHAAKGAEKKALDAAQPKTIHYFLIFYKIHISPDFVQVLLLILDVLQVRILKKRPNQFPQAFCFLLAKFL